MKYEIFLTDQFNDSLQNMIFYIQETNSQKSAIQVLERIEKSIMNLSDFPYMSIIPKHKTIRKLGYRIFIVDKCFIFYKVFEEEKKIGIYACCDYRQDYINIL